MKTAYQIQGDFYNLLKQSNLAKNITGKVYREGYRPKDSQKEDAIVIFTTGIPTQIHQGSITINIYTPFVDIGGTLLENGKRCEQLEIMAGEWVKSILGESPYLIQLAQTIHTNQDTDIHQSFVVVRLRYELFDYKY